MDFTLIEARTGISVVLLPDTPHFTIVAVSNDFLKTLGVKKSAIIGKGHFEILPKNPDDLQFTGEQNLRASYKQVIRHKEPHHLPLQRYDISNGDGTFSEKYWKVVNVPVFDKDGQVHYIIHTSEDITAQIKADQKAASAKGIEKAYQFFMAAPVIIGFVKGDDYIIELANEGLLEVWGRTADVIGTPLLKAIPELEAQGFAALLEQVRTTGEPFYAYEHPITLLRRGKEEVLYFDFIYKPFYETGTAGKASGIISVGLDVTERVKARQAVRESSQELALAIEVANLGTFRLDLLTNLAINSEKINEWFGHTEHGYSREERFNAIHPEDRERVDRVILSTMQTEENSRHDVSYRVVHPADGTVRHLRSYGKTLFDEKGTPYLIIGIIQDITPQMLQHKLFEENELELQQKVLARTLELENLNEELKRSNTNLEEFAYAASHDLKEPIRKIRFFGERLKSSLAERLREEEKVLLDRMDAAARRMGSLIDDLLAYSEVSTKPQVLKSVDLNEVIELVLNDLDLEVEEKGATINVDKLCVVKGHHRQLQQAFQNLLGNAIKYSKTGTAPYIRVTCDKVPGANTGLSLSYEDKQKEFYLLSIIDNGIGFDQKDAERIFNVFTRLHGSHEFKGTGVGLSIVQKIIDNHNGYIVAEGGPEGATFKVYLPVN